MLLCSGESEYVPFYGLVCIIVDLNSIKMYITLRDALKIMVYFVPVSLLPVHQLRVAKTAIVGMFSLSFLCIKTFTGFIRLQKDYFILNPCS
jgi:hypothetical protein